VTSNITHPAPRDSLEPTGTTTPIFAAEAPDAGPASPNEIASASTPSRVPALVPALGVPAFLLTTLAGLAALLMTASGAHAEITAITPCRILDTREAGEGPALAGQTTRDLVVRGLCEIPPEAVGITYNATIVAPTGSGFLTLHPSDENLPVASSVNFATGATQGNAGLAKLGATEPSLSAYLATNPGGSTGHLVLDVTGYQKDSLATMLTNVTARLSLVSSTRTNGVTVDRWTEHGDGTATDKLTGLVWELKNDDPGSIHYRENLYTWSGASPFEDPDGTAFTMFLATLNTEPCLAGSCDWRIPTIEELVTLVEPSGIDCTSKPCTTIPGGTGTNGPSTEYFSSSTVAGLPTGVWEATLYTGFVDDVAKFASLAVRAVRGGP